MIRAIFQGCVLVAMCAVGVVLGGPCGLVVMAMLGLTMIVIDESARSRRQESDRVIRALDRTRRGLPPESSGPGWGLIAVALVVLLGLLGYARMRAKGYSSPSDLLHDVAEIASR